MNKLMPPIQLQIPLFTPTLHVPFRPKCYVVICFNSSVHSLPVILKSATNQMQLRYIFVISAYVHIYQ